MGLNKRIEAIAQDLANGLEIQHYLCQPCFDKGIKAVLQKFGSFGSISLRCPICETCFDTGQTEPFVG